MRNQYSKSYLYFLLIILAALAFACEDEISVPSQFESSQLAIDAWLTNVSEPQTITLSQTVDYFEGGVPATVENATIRVCNDSTQTCFDFLHTTDGRYVWEPINDETFGTVGDAFTLTVIVDGNTYLSNEQINRTAEIDSIGIEFEEESIAFEEGLYGQLYARDLPGRGDTYWLRTYKNDTLLNRPEEVVAVYDATFDAGADIDGIYFILGLRLGINEIDDDGAFVPYVSGDHIRAEVHSINNTAFSFLNIAQEQILNEGIFAVPVANTPGNVRHAETGNTILGVFNIAEVSVMERAVE
ncbi:MAG: DUF4249 family protein [Bacteroidota bacterium]